MSTTHVTTLLIGIEAAITIVYIYSLEHSLSPRTNQGGRLPNQVRPVTLCRPSRCLDPMGIKMYAWEESPHQHHQLVVATRHHQQQRRDPQHPWRTAPTAKKQHPLLEPIEPLQPTDHSKISKSIPLTSSLETGTSSKHGRFKYACT